MDIAVHYHGFAEEDVAEALGKFGFEPLPPGHFTRYFWKLLPTICAIMWGT